MELKLLFIPLIFFINIIHAQDKFEKSIKALETELDYHIITDSIIETSKPGYDLLKRFDLCSEYHESLKNLDFKSIKSVRLAELKQSHHENYIYPQFTFEQWMFQYNKDATEFIAILEKEDYRINECISKGGVIWWQIDNNIYFIISKAFFMTYKYDEIKMVIDKYL